MLRYLRISNFAIIDQIEIEFQEGLNVLTGETGAGKSILIGALGLILGARGGADQIRTGADEALVEAIFEGSDISSIDPDLESTVEGSGELIISRRINRSGRSKCFANGRLTTISMLERIGNSLVTVFGQHESHMLLDPDEHIEILDRSANLQTQRKKLERLFHVVRKASNEVLFAKNRLHELETQATENKSMALELGKANLKLGEEEQLSDEREILKKVAQIREKAYDAYQKLYSKSGSVISNLSEIRKLLAALVALNPKTNQIVENFSGAVYQLEDVALELRNISENTNDDPARLEEIEERLSRLKTLKKKYGGDVEHLMQRLQSVSNEVSAILNAEKDFKDCQKRFESAEKDFLIEAETLSKQRRQAAIILETSMKKELSDLAMRDAVFSVNFNDRSREISGAKGLETIEFFLAANPGESARPLAKIASGGELSRVMLALKTLEIDSTGQASTLVFDEVDAGIGGHTAVAIADRLAQVARRQQTICITHLHQIAARADHHLAVRKFVKEGRTSIEANALHREERISELARMLGASEDSAPVREHVRNLVKKTKERS
jgi:DNA repair protein RecN (Recombination protein N)